MKTKLGAALLAALMMFGLFGVANAAADPDPEGPAKKGLCTAYFNGQKKGHDKKESDPGPFEGLEQAADDGEPDNDGDGENDENLAAELADYSDVFEYCDGLIGGQPEHNGRYDCLEPSAEDGRDNDTDGQVECYPNTGGSDTDEDGNPYDTGGDHPSGKNR